MKEKLIIKNFGPIKDVELEFGRFNVLIGEQATGKSTIAKLIAAINNMAQGETLAAGASGVMRVDEYGRINHFRRHLKVYEIDSFIQSDTFISYTHFFFEFRLELLRSEVIKGKNISGADLDISWLSTTFIPADRAAVNLLSVELLLSINQVGQDLPGYFIKYAQLYNRIKKKESKFDFSDTLGVTYEYENELDTIVLKDGKKIAIANASSAIQTNMSMLMVLNHQAKSEIYRGLGPSDFNLSVIEEPELNCFPDLQKKLLQYIFLCVHPLSYNGYMRRVFITTHSPYILTSLNNLIYACKVGVKDPEKVSRVIEKHFWINSDDVSAYRIMPDGTAKTIISKTDDGTLIEAEEIDEISTKINFEFDELLRIDLGLKSRADV